MRGLELLRAVSNSPGAAVLHGEFRRGLKDLQDLTIAFPDSKQSRDEANTIDNPTQFVATQERRGRELSPTPEPAAPEPGTRSVTKVRDREIEME